MPQPPLSTSTIRKLLRRCAANNFNKAQTARQLGIARSSATKYINAYKRSSLALSQIDSMPRAKLIDLLFIKSKSPTLSHRKLWLLARLPSIHSRIETDGLSVLDAWREEAVNQRTYKYSQFAALYAIWRSERGLGRISRAKGQLITVSSTDCAVLKSWQRSHDRRKWEVSVALLGLSSCHTISEICRKIGRARRTVEKWCVAYERVGIDGVTACAERLGGAL
jgi:hypothetical protein